MSTSDYTQAQGGEELERSLKLSQQRVCPPCEVPGYEPRRFLGAGAYGEVWVAMDRTTGRQVAIKFYLHRSGLDWSLLSHEVEKLAFLSADRYVVQLLDVGWEAEPPYYVMEYMERGSLEERLEEGLPSVDEAVALTRDVAQGLEMAGSASPDVILMDLDLPEIDGWEATRRIRANPATCSIPVIALTAHAMQQDLKKAVVAGCNQYETKPVMFARLVGKINACINRSADGD